MLYLLKTNDCTVFVNWGYASCTCLAMLCSFIQTSPLRTCYMIAVQNNSKAKKMATAAWGWWNTDLYVGAICVFGCILDDTQHIHLMFCADSMLLEPNLMLGKGHALKQEQKQWCISLISVYCSILDQGFEPPDLLGWKVIISLSHWLFSVVSGLEHFVLHLYKCQMT